MNYSDRIDPQLYQLQHSEEEDVSFWMDLARNFNSPILEIGCGTGRILISLARADCQVVGLDINLEMLKYLKKQLKPQFRKRINIFQADAGTFHLKCKYPLIFLACNILSTMETGIRQRVYNRIYEHLTEEGIFATSIPNPKRLDDLPVYGESTLEQIYIHPETGNPIQISSEWERCGQTIIFRWHYDHLFPDGRVERSTVENKHVIIRLEDYLDELQSADLYPVAVYGDFDKSEYSEEAPYLILLARRGIGELPRPGF